MTAPTARPRLTRDRDHAMLGGVCGGIAKRYGYDPTVVRVAAVLLSVAWGAGIVVYLALWVLMPAETPEAAASDGTAAGDPLSAEVVALGAAGAAVSPPASGTAAGAEDLGERARRTAEELAVAARNAAEAARAAADQLVVAARAASAAGRESWEQQRAPRTEGVADASVDGATSEGGAAEASEVTAGAGAPDVAGERERA